MDYKETILIVDDSALNRMVLIEILGKENYTFLEAENGQQAVELLDCHPEVDLLLLDITMPEIDGFGVLEAMNQYHWIEETPVIMISAEDSYTFVERAYDLGASDYITRPFDARVVCRRVSNTLMLECLMDGADQIKQAMQETEEEKQKDAEQSQRQEANRLSREVLQEEGLLAGRENQGSARKHRENAPKTSE